MRITNNMITQNTKTNINSNKVNVDLYNTQMTTQKKISRPSDDPVIAIRSLRLSTSLSHINQYVDNNIPDATSWLDVTETALVNMKSILTDIRTQCVNGSTDTLTSEDRNTILKQLSALADQVYSEGNADYAGRTVFTGFRTSSNLTFDKDQTDTSYQITQKFESDSLAEQRYYSDSVNVPDAIDSGTANCDVAVTEHEYYRMRLAYGDTASVESFTIGTEEYSADATVANSYTVYESEKDWQEATGATLGDDEVIFLKDKGEFVFGATLATDIRANETSLEVTYTKTGFESGDVRPEFYYDCIDQTDPDPARHISYTKEDQEINYTIANSTTLTVNTQADAVFDTSIARDVNELINVVQTSINANAKVDKIKSMMAEAQYSDDASQAKLQTYLDAAQREADYADDNLQKTYESYIGNFEGYLEKVNLSITNVGSMQDRLELTQSRVESQETNITELKSGNEDRDISDIIIDYYAAYNAYTASLTAASKVGEQTLLNYL